MIRCFLVIYTKKDSMHEMRNTIKTGGLLLCVFCLFSNEVRAENTRYQTNESLEPDIWASVWLIDRVLGVDGSILVEAESRKRIGYTSYGYPGADIYTVKGSHYKLLVEKLEINDPVLTQLGDLVAGVEDLGWQSQNNVSVASFEADFRKLQASYGRYWVPVGCYKEFFDGYYNKLAGKSIDSAGPSAELSNACDELKMSSDILRPSIPMIPIDKVVEELGNDKKVVFVDTREPSEFEEQHIPGAINLPFRDIAKADLSLLEDADIVVPYCIKDFRGFEAARRLQELGVEKVSLLDPFGLAGWREKKLPVAGEKGLTESEALSILQDCASTNCLADEHLKLQ